MKFESFLIYIDLLGYEKKAKEEAKLTGRPVEDIRKSYVDSLERRLDRLNENDIISFLYKNHDEGFHDDFLIFTETIQKAFFIINEAMKAGLPLEIAIGLKEFDDTSQIQRKNETIEYLKSNIINKFIQFCKDEYGDSPHQTFILLTTELYNKLDFDSKKICFKPYLSAKFWLIDIEKFLNFIKISKFLEKIGTMRSEYRNIEKLYVKPYNYDNIIKTLNDYNIVFIIGDAEIGKTYTSIKLLWEYSKEGYEPVYFPEEKREKQWGIIRHSREFEGKVIYFEDPWGKIEFKNIDSLFKEIGMFITIVKDLNCKIIITSREKVFKEFEKRKETSENLWRYVNHLKINLAYSYENLISMLEKYIEVFEPIWANNERNNKIIFEAIGNNLRTPMSINKVIFSSKHIKNTEELKHKINDAAEETKITFSREIKEIYYNGEYDKLTFLVFSYLEINVVEAKLIYRELLKEFVFDFRGRDFEELIEEFNEVEIFTRTPIIGGYYYSEHAPSLKFIHASYWEAFQYALTDNGNPNNLNKKIYSRVLLILSKKPGYGIIVARRVANDFDLLVENTKNELLQNLYLVMEADMTLASLIVRYYDKLEQRERSLLFKIIERNKTKAVPLYHEVKMHSYPISFEQEIAFVIVNHMNELLENSKNELFSEISYFNEVVEALARAFNFFTINIETFPEKFKKKLIPKTLKIGSGAISVDCFDTPFSNQDYCKNSLKIKQLERLQDICIFNVEDYNNVLKYYSSNIEIIYYEGRYITRKPSRKL